MLRPSALLLVLSTALASASDVTITDLLPGSAGSYPSYLTVHDGYLYFRANGLSGGTDVELCRYDGVTAERIADINPGPEGSSPADLTFFGETLYFSAQGCYGCGTKLWQYDEPTGVSLSPGSDQQAGNPQEMTAYKGKLYFRAFRSNIGIELWEFDGITQRPIDIFTGTGSSYPQHFIEFDGKLYFNACGKSAVPDGTELFYFDGLQVRQAANINPTDGSSPENFVIYGGDLYFSALADDKGRELWRYDGVQAVRVTDIFPGPEASNPSGMTVYDGAIYFSAEDGVHGYELWRYDGTSAQLVANINQNPVLPDVDPIHHSWPSNFKVFDGILYFSADDGVHGRELWRYDGESVELVADIYPGQYGSEVQELTVYQDSLYFAANDGQHGGELGQAPTSVFRLKPGVSYRRGDVNEDGENDVSDAVTVLLFLFGGQAELVSCEKSADVDDSGILDLSDAISLLGVLFLGAPPPPEPFAECGVDSTQDDLTCRAYGLCN